MQNNNAPFKPIMQKQWNFVSIELIQIAGSDLLKSRSFRSVLYTIEIHNGTVLCNDDMKRRRGMY